MCATGIIEVRANEHHATQTKLALGSGGDAQPSARKARLKQKIANEDAAPQA